MLRKRESEPLVRRRLTLRSFGLFEYDETTNRSEWYSRVDWHGWPPQQWDGKKWVYLDPRKKKV